MNPSRLAQSIPIQDLSGEKLLASAQRVEHSGKSLPAIQGIPLLAKLGQGGMGAVYLGMHPRLKKEVAVKVLPFHTGEYQAEAVQRFFQEAQLAASIESPHLVHVLDVNEDGGFHFLVMEYVRGTSAGAYLKSILKSGQSGLPEAVALDICIAASEGLAAAHAAGVVHRDIKPDNILIPQARDDQTPVYISAKLADLGLARLEDNAVGLTVGNTFMGTPGFAAPEQIEDARSAGRRSDVFSMGATLYALLSGRAAFAGQSPFKVFQATVQEAHTAIATLRPDVSRSTSILIDRCLEKSPDNRYDDGAALAMALKECRSVLRDNRASVRIVVSRTALSVSREDITKLKVDAIVNSCSETLATAKMTGKLHAAIHAAAGPEMLDECLALGNCPTGQARLTKGYRLPAKYVIHAVGPVWRGGSHNEAALLSSCYRAALEAAVHNGVKSIAFPPISSGTYGYPLPEACRIAIREVTSFVSKADSIDQVVFVCQNPATQEVYQRVLGSVSSLESPPADEHSRSESAEPAAPTLRAQTDVATVLSPQVNADSEKGRQSYDLIADIHGYATELKSLLERLGYRIDRGCYRHPARRAIFVGDFIDRGAQILETLEIAKAMVDAGAALAVMGNHEYNAICYHTPDGNGGFLRAHSEKYMQQHRATLDAFADSPSLWCKYLDWFKSLPMFLEVNGVRVVHACWHEQGIAALGGKDRLDESLLLKSVDKRSPEYRAVDTLLKGMELALPEGYFFDDKEGFRRDKIRTRWWLNGRGKTYRELVYPDCDTVPDLKAPAAESDCLSGYPDDSPPVFVGHYWLPPAPPRLAAPNVACLDYSVAKGGPLVAYRWDGEQRLEQGKFVASFKI